MRSLRHPARLDELLNYRLQRLHAASGAPVVRLLEGRFGITRREWRLLGTLADRGPTSPSQLALAWVMAQSGRGGNPTVVPIPGTRKPARLDENLGARELRLTADDLARIDRVMPPGAAAGTRYGAAQMQALNG